MQLSSYLPALFFGLCVSFSCTLTAQTSGPVPQAKHTSLPIVFEENRGQFDASTRYVVRNAGGVVEFHANGPEFLMGTSKTRTRITLQPVTPATKTDLSSEEVTPGKVNYFLGQTATAQLQGISTYGKVRYSNFMTGVDLSFYGNGDNLEHDFILSPQVEPKSVVFRLNGAGSLKLKDNGELLIQAPGSQLLFRRPVGYQLIDGRRTSVDVAFVLSPGGDLSFQAGQYNHTQPLVIDPVLVFSTYLDGTHQDSPTSVITDNTGNIYVAGYTTSPDFPIANAYQSSCGTCTGGGFGEAGVLSKLDPTGKTLLYSTYFLGSGLTDIFRIKVDNFGNLVGVGYSASGFPKVGNYPGTYSSGTFVFSLNPAGTALNHAEVIGAGQSASSFNDSNGNPYGLAIDSSNNVYIADAVSLNVNGGTFPLPVTTGTYGSGNKVAGETTSIYVAKIGPDGSLFYGTLVPPINPSAAPYGFYLYMGGLAVDASGNLYVSATASAGMPTTANAASTAFPNTMPANTQYSGDAGYVFALDPKAAQLLFATYLPGTDSANTLAIAADGSLYVAGTTSETTLPVSANAFQAALKPGANCTCDGGYALNLSGDGGKILHATYLSGTIDYNNEVTAYGSTVLDSTGNVFIGGNVTSVDSPLQNPVVSYLDDTTNLYARGTYVAGLTPDLSKLIFGSYFSGPGAGDLLADMTVSPAGRLVLTGSTFSNTNFLTTPGALQPTAPAQPNPGVGYQHEFVASIDLTVPAPSVCLSSRSVNFGKVAVGNTNSVTFTLTNCGNAPLNISSLTSTSPVVSATPLSSALPAGQSYPIQVQFAPADSTVITGSITIASNAVVATQSVSFSGQGLAPQLAIQSPAATSPVAFPQMVLGSTPATTVAFLLRNTGNAPLTITSASVSGEFTLLAKLYEPACRKRHLLCLRSAGPQQRRVQARDPHTPLQRPHPSHTGSAPRRHCAPQLSRPGADLTKRAGTSNRRHQGLAYPHWQ